jgi:amino acid adenylation domain-containing protein
LAKWREDGKIEFIGRNDDQVKVRGCRIELGEIEGRLGEHEGVQEAAVVVRTDKTGEKRLVAYYTSAAGKDGDEDITAEQLRGHLGKRLPEYMVPAAYVRMEKLPLTVNGKVDRKALPDPEDAYVQRSYEAPVGEVEQMLAAIWSELLGVKQVGRWDNFFELGGHSLLLVRVTARIRQNLGLEVSVGELFAHPVLCDFAGSVKNSVRSKLPPIVAVERKGYLPLSFAQQRLWFLEQMEGVGETYHIPFALHLEGRLNREALREALQRLVERHEVLRTRFAVVEGEPVQHIEAVEQSRFELVEEKLGGSGEEEQQEQEKEERVREWMEAEAGRSFDLVKGPLIRGRLLQQDEQGEEHTLLLTMHHIVSDGWSMGILVNELSRLYSAQVKGEADPLEKLEVQYGDYAVWQRRWLEGEVLKEQAEYWRKALKGMPELLELPWEKGRGARQDFRGAVVRVELEEGLTAGLKELSRRQETTLFMTLVAGWGALLSRLSGQEEVGVGVPVANRGRAEIEGLIGFFVNTQVLRVGMSGNPTVEELLGRVKKEAMGAQQNQDIPFEQVVELVRPVRSLAHSPLFQVMFALQNTPGGEMEFAGLKVKTVAVEGSKAKFDLTLGLEERAGGGIGGGLEYATALFRQGTVERYVEYYRALLRGMVGGRVGMRVGEIALLSRAEREQMVYGWNETRSEYPREKCVHELFEEQVERRGEATAVEYGEQRLTYGELNRRANRLAHYLREMGVGPEECVGICVERGVEMVVGFVAVLKAGGAYVPLDASYPAERLRYMVEDSGPKVVLVEGSRAGVLAGLGTGVRVVEMERGEQEWGQKGESNVEVGGARGTGVKPWNLAYVIYTSGSMGQPKGVMIEHGNVMRLVRNTNYVELGSGDVIAQASNASFDAVTFEIWGALLNGGYISYVGKQELLTPGLLGEKLRGRKINTMFLTTALFNQVAREEAGAFAGMRYVLFGGEQVDAGMVARVVERGGVEHLLHVYGPTETTTFATWEEVKEMEEGRTVPIGAPLGNTQIYILDEMWEPVPVGVKGELYIGGEGVGRG